MKLLAPVSSLEEVLPLIGAGAEEIYCGLVPADWQQSQDPATWLNRRSARGANLRTIEDLAALVRLARGQDVPVFLTLNAHHYTDPQVGRLVDLARSAADVGVEAFIVSDFALLAALHGAGIAQLHLSSLAVCINSEAVRFWQELGVKRIILPRHLTLDEIGQVAAACPDVAFEVFLLNDGCVYEEGLCLTTHEWGPFCLEPWAYNFRPLTERAENYRADWEAAVMAYQRFRWATNNCGCTTTPRGLPLGPCALCHLDRFAKSGIASLKIVGREASSIRKLASVQLAKNVLETWRGSNDPVTSSARARSLRNTPELCASGYTCYFR